MRPPPGSRRPILLARPIHDWLNRVAEKHRQFASLQLSPEQRASLDRRLEARFVHATLSLEGLDITEAEVARVIATPRLKATPTSELEGRILGLLEGLRLVLSLTQSEGTATTLTPDLLLKLGGVAEFRKTPGSTEHPLKPIAPEHLSVSIESACRWFSAESFAELNPIEQASIVHLRLLEIQPFEEANERPAVLAASLFTLRSGLPPLIIKPDFAGAYRAAIEEAARGNTQPMVEFVGTAVERALSDMLGLVD